MCSGRLREGHSKSGNNMQMQGRRKHVACLGSNKLSLTGEDSSRRKEEAVAVEIGWEMMGRNLNAGQEAGAPSL